MADEIRRHWVFDLDGKSLGFLAWYEDDDDDEIREWRLHVLVGRACVVTPYRLASESDGINPHLINVADEKDVIPIK